MGSMSRLEAMRAAVERDDGMCVICGRPCGATDVRQRIDPEAAVDSPSNWVAMCRGCQESLANRMPPPARFVYHIHDRTKLRRQLYELGRWTLLTTTAACWFGFTGLLGYLMYLGADGVGWHLMTMLSAFFLLGWAWKFFEAWRLGPQQNVQQVHHTFDPQVVHMREGR